MESSLGTRKQLQLKFTVGILLPLTLLRVIFHSVPLLLGFFVHVLSVNVSLEMVQVLT